MGLTGICRGALIISLMGVVPLGASLFRPVAAAGEPLEARAQESAGTFNGTSSADGVRVYYEVKGFLIVERFIDGGAPVAQASVSSLESVGFSSAPYPGDTVVSAPGLVGGSLGAPVADFPLIAQSRYPSQERSSVAYGAVQLTSESGAHFSRASGAGGGPDADGEPAALGATRSNAEVAFDETTGEVMSTATANAESFTVAGVFRIGRVFAMARVVDRPGGEPERTSELAVGQVTIAGQTVALTEEGFVLGGASTPLPDSSPLLKALVDRGIDVRYLAAEESADGVVSPGIEVRIEHGVPGSTSPGVVVYRFGRASASATGGIGTVQDSAVSGASPTRDDGSARLPAGPSISRPESPMAVAAIRSDSTDEFTAADRAIVGIEGNTISTVPQWDRAWTLAFYLVIVLAGIGAVGGAQLIRVLGVRMPWTS